MKLSYLNLKKTILGGAIICIAVLSAAFQFTSCKNFLNAKGVKDEIEDVIAYNNAKTINVSISCDKEMGAVFPEGSYVAKLGYAFEIQYVPNTENYIIKSESEILESVNRYTYESKSDYVEFTSIEQSIEDKKLGLYRIKAKIVKDADDILIRPVKSIRPKVQEIFPVNTTGGVPQDSIIRVTFNKPINPESFGTFDCIRILDSSNRNITSFYGEPYFSNNNTILNIPAVYGKSIISEDSDYGSEDITLIIDFTNIIDSEGISVAQNNDYTFRINKNVDKVKPVLTSLVLKSSSDTSSVYYKTLTDKSFENWNDNSTAQNPKGDYSNNHIGKSFYIEVTGYDKDSGVNGIQVVETFYRNLENQPTDNPVQTGYCGTNSFVYLSTDANNNDIYYLDNTYTFKSFYDGVFKLDISVLDNAGNASTPLTYYVIKDTTIESTSIRFLETEAYSDYRAFQSWDEDGDGEPDPYNYIDIFDVARFQQNGLDTVVLTLSDISVETFFKGCTSKYDAEIYYGYSKDSINTKASKVNNKFSFTRDATKITLLKLICTDAVGNTTEFLRAIPPKPIISTCTSVAPNYVESWENVERYDYVNIVAGSQSLDAMAEEYGADSTGLFYVVRNKTIENANYGASPNAHYSIIQDYSGDDNWKTYDYYIVQYFRYGQTFWYSVVSDNYVTVSAKSIYGENRINDDVDITLSSTLGKTKKTTYEPYCKDYITVTTESCGINSGVYKITVDNYKHLTNDTAGVVYTFVAKDNSSLEVYKFSEPTFYLKSMRKYSLHVYAEKEGDAYYYEPTWLYMYINGSTSRNGTLSLTEDLYPPSFDDSEHKFTSDNAAFFIETSVPQDMPLSPTAGTRAGMYEAPEKPGYGKIDYYFIPNSSNDINSYSLYTIQELENFEKHTLFYKLTDSSLKIPYGEIEEGLYTLCMVAYDKNDNYSVKCVQAFNKTMRGKLPVDFILTDDLDDPYEFSSPVDFCLDFYNTSTNEWENVRTFLLPETPFFGDEDENLRYTFEVDGKDNPDYDGWMKIYGPKFNYTVDGGNVYYHNDIFNSGFYYVDYKYMPYEKLKIDPSYKYEQGKSKNIVEGRLGIQVYCDKSVYSHTMYSSKKLAEQTDADAIAVWESKGLETGIIVSDTDFSYTSEYYDSIPSGSFYTTILHFADGTVYMTEIKQK